MSFGATLVSFVLSFGLLIIAMSIHEFAHGWVAYRLGDTTAKYAGRLTLNPLAHIDPFWTLILPLFLFISSGGKFVFGAAKPVPINYLALKNPKRDIIWIGVSGPAANFILASLLAIVINTAHLPIFFASILLNLIVINIILGIFNLIPIPPLDGSRILMGLLPESLASGYSSIEPYSFIILLALIWMGAFDRIVWPLVAVTLKLLKVY
ncbi:MAG: site-2 protease family protein [Candidatus Omnitrophica bacterium]|nr:site-2 protease family protein [Candidatus Omnitrophota bacterium]